MVLVVAPAQVTPVLKTLSKLGEKPVVVGKVVRGGGDVRIVES
jgi:phosphoribosylaminoimidazole (AIR) synthetase